MVNDAPGSIYAPGLVFQGRYRLDECLANGGMAQVWRGQDLILQRGVAIKLLHPHLASDAELVERFRREAISAARLSHPNIVPTFDTGSDHSAAYIVLGLVDGPTLHDVLKEQTFTPLEASAIGRQVADALDHAHQHGLIHRDIKPSNIMLVDDNKRVMVADFGIAKAISDSLDASLTLPGIVLGTPAYIAPEQLQDGDISPAVDLYALGVLLHEMVCGHTTVDAPTQHVTQAPSTPSGPCAAIPGQLAAVITKATAHAPHNRFDSAATMSLALHDCERAFRKLLPPEPAEVARTSPQDRPATPTTAIKQRAAPAPAIRGSRPPVHDVALARKAAQRRKTLTIASVVTLVLAAVVAGRIFAGVELSNRKGTTTTTTLVRIAGATSFDPQGSDKVENPGQTGAVIDGSATSSWSTETYASRRFGNLKNGLGLILDLGGSTDLTSIDVTTSSSGWAASAYVSDSSGSQLSDWGQPVTSSLDIGAGTTTFHLDGAHGSYVLLWITDLGTANRVTISDIQANRR